VKKEKIFIIGARRGLGKEILQQWQSAYPEHIIAATSRREWQTPVAETFIFDMSLTDQVEQLLKKIEMFLPNRVFYVAGGGPHGAFSEKPWKDHVWALQVSLLSPLRILNFCLQLSSVEQFVAVGSSIAESQPDPYAASYAAAKHGLKGCISSLQGEELHKQVRLFSPGYMSTDMLPIQAQRRIGQDAPVDSAQLMAKLFIDWAQNPKASWHWEGRPRT
jgi:NAD(P)-dependent dehydrogenase (short-subunit alcohol dehydrogenase family)